LRTLELRQRLGRRNAYVFDAGMMGVAGMCVHDIGRKLHRDHEDRSPKQSCPPHGFHHRQRCIKMRALSLSWINSGREFLHMTQRSARPTTAMSSSIFRRWSVLFPDAIACSTQWAT
jgi:hypothetical protein